MLTRKMCIRDRLSLLQGVDGGETVEDIQFGIKLIIVVECRYIIIDVYKRQESSAYHERKNPRETFRKHNRW